MMGVTVPPAYDPPIELLVKEEPVCCSKYPEVTAGSVPTTNPWSPFQGFVVGTDPAVTSGYLEQQTGSSFTNSSIGGSYAGGTVTPIIPQVTDAATWLLADASGNLNGTSDTSGPNGPGQQNFAYTYTVDSTGRTVVQQSGTPIGIAYVISPTKFVLLPTTDPNPALSILGQ